jgi:hypothetical protein
MFAEHFDRAGNKVDRLCRGGRIVFEEKIDEPLEVTQSGRRVNYARHRLGFGFAAFFPAARALTYPCTSSIA